jgi:hypothetical protein
LLSEFFNWSSAFWSFSWGRCRVNEAIARL